MAAAAARRTFSRSTTRRSETPSASGVSRLRSVRFRGTVSGSSATGYQTEVLADSPLLYVRFQETSGAPCANIGSLGGNATAAGTFVRNISTGFTGLGVAINLDGISGTVSYPDTASLDITGDVTYELWVNPTTLANRTLLSKGVTGTPAGYQLAALVSGVIRVSKQSTAVILDSPANVVAGSWQHIAFTRSGNTYTIYYNGASVATVTDSTTIDATSEVFAIGHFTSSGTASNFYIGSFDEVAVYNTALSPARIAAHYAAR